MGTNPEFKQYNSVLISHPILKNSEISLATNTIRTSVNVIDDYEIQTWIMGLHKVKNTESKNIFSPLSYKIKSRAMCGASCTVSLKYENYPYILMDEIINRCKINRRFEENQLWYLMYVLLEAASTCLSIQGKIGDPRPHNLLFNEIGQLKVLHRYSYPGQVTNFQKTLMDRTQTFISPEQMLLINKNRTFNNTNHQISESFSIGLTILCAMFLEDLSYIYDTGNMIIKQTQLALKISQLSELQYFSSENKTEQLYSVEFVMLVSQLLEFQPNERLSSIQLHKWLKPFARDILNFEEFRFKYPEKSVSASNNLERLKRINSLSVNTPIHQNTEVFINKNIPHLKSRLSHALTINQKVHRYPQNEQELHIQSNQDSTSSNQVKTINHDALSFKQSEKSCSSKANQISNIPIFQPIYIEGVQQSPPNKRVQQPSPNRRVQQSPFNTRIEQPQKTKKITMSDLEGPQQNSNRQKPNKKFSYLIIEDAAASTSSVFPVTATSIGQQQGFNNKVTWGNKPNNYMQDNDLLEKLDQQLYNSKQRFPA